MRERWSIENSWHWVRDVILREDAHRYREENGVQILATLRSLAIHALAHDLKALLELMGGGENQRRSRSLNDF